ncbi:MAG: outer membrane protein assembly factor BamD [Bacteroidales bacterium]|nr:outer membrane protein assembly factor BamD [Bacteroidales bacterium]MBO4565959.1 outer membrane protein assembly factor BamD [Bacteroidales bacterium]
MKQLRIIAAILLAAAAFSCKSSYETLLESTDAGAKYDAAFDYFNQGKYAKSAQLFESLVYLTNGTERDDTVQYYWGLSNYRAKDYYTAETNFDNFIKNFPGSPFAENAEFLRLDCLFRGTLRYELDQTPTYKCITAISEYLMNHPDTEYRSVCDRMMDDLEERLDRKAYENAYLYYKMEDYKAARVALRNVLKDDAENRYREDILFYTAMASYNYAQLSVKAKQKERFLVFYDDYLNFVGEYPDSPKRPELDRIYKKAKEKY